MPFVPNKANTASLAVTSISNRAALLGNGKAVRIYNSGSVPVFLQVGNGAVTATTANMPLSAGATEVFGLNNNITHVAAITATGAATVYLTRGEVL